MSINSRPYPIRAAVLDTCVLLQSYLLDVLLTAAERNLFVVHWSVDSLGELAEHYVAIRSVRHGIDPVEARTQIERKITAMNAAFPAATVSGLSDLDHLQLRDPDDRHVLAAAIKAQATYIVTRNLRDFAPVVLAAHGVRLESPDSFLLSLLEAWPNEMLEVLSYVSDKTRRPHLEIDDLLVRLGASAPRFVTHVEAILREPRTDQD